MPDGLNSTTDTCFSRQSLNVSRANFVLVSFYSFVCFCAFLLLFVCLIVATHILPLLELFSFNISNRRRQRRSYFSFVFICLLDFVRVVINFCLYKQPFVAATFWQLLFMFGAKCTWNQKLEFAFYYFIIYLSYLKTKLVLLLFPQSIIFENFFESIVLFL